MKSDIREWPVAVLFVPVFCSIFWKCKIGVPDWYQRLIIGTKRCAENRHNSTSILGFFTANSEAILVRNRAAKKSPQRHTVFSNDVPQWHTDSVPSVDHARHKSTSILPGICYKNASFLHPMKRNIMIIGRFYAPLESDAAYQIGCKFICTERVLNACGIDTDCTKNTETSR